MARVFKHFSSYEGTEWYSILKTQRLEFDTGNPEHPYLTVGSWTMSRFGKPVIVGKDNKFYQSVLDAFRERNPATVSKVKENKEIEVPIKHLTMVSDLEQEPERPHRAGMHEYRPYLRLVGEHAEETVSQQPSVSENMVVDQPEYSGTSMDKSATISSSKEATSVSSKESHRVESKRRYTPSSPPSPSHPRTPQKPRDASTKVGHGLQTPVIWICGPKQDYSSCCYSFSCYHSCYPRCYSCGYSSYCYCNCCYRYRDNRACKKRARKKEAYSSHGRIRKGLC